MDLTPMEYAVLELVNSLKGEATWYSIGILLPLKNIVPQEVSEYQCLKDLEARGLILMHEISNRSKEKWKITDAGLAVLEQREE